MPESEIWLRQQHSGGPGSLRLLWRKDLRRNGLLATAMNACAMFGYWGLFTWIPAYLALPVAEGGRGLDLMKTTIWLVVMGVGKWSGYALFGFFADAFGRRRSYVAYLLIAAALVPLYGMRRDAVWLLVLGPFVAFFGTGFFSGFSAIASELFPTEVRATAMGLSYNVGRGLSAAAPAVVGLLATRFGLGSAFFLLAAAFFAAALLALDAARDEGQAARLTASHSGASSAAQGTDHALARTGGASRVGQRSFEEGQMRRKRAFRSAADREAASESRGTSKILLASSYRSPGGLRWNARRRGQWVGRGDDRRQGLERAQPSGPAVRAGHRHGRGSGSRGEGDAAGSEGKGVGRLRAGRERDESRLRGRTGVRARQPRRRRGGHVRGRDRPGHDAVGPCVPARPRPSRRRRTGSCGPGRVRVKEGVS